MNLKKGYMVIGIIVAVIVIFGAMIISSYNSFVNLEENVDQSYAQIENQLQRRLDLIPNLVNTVKGFASHEKEVIASISDARARLAGANTPK
jgi:LemA protein